MFKSLCNVENFVQAAMILLILFLPSSTQDVLHNLSLQSSSQAANSVKLPVTAWSIVCTFSFGVHLTYCPKVYF